MMGLMEYLSKQPKSFLITLAFVLIAFIGFIDYIIGPEPSFSIFYLIPVSLVTWFMVRWVGILTSVVSAITWVIADLASGHTYSHPVIPYWNMTVRFGFFVIVTLTLSELKNVLASEKKLGRMDSLTGIANTRYFNEFTSIEINRAHRYKRPTTLAYIDLDNFKAVNDRFGHSTGDALLQSVANIIQKNIRITDLVARLGGDEFAILFTEIGSKQVQVIIDRIQKNLLDIMERNGWPVTFSIGVATFLSPPSTVDEMVGIADNLMYSVKSSGKNKVKYEVFGQQENSLQRQSPNGGFEARGSLPRGSRRA